MAMMMQTGASASKVLILVGAGLTGTVVLRSGKLFDIILQLQELLKGVNESEISPEKYDGALLASQIQQLAREIRELTLSRPVTIYNGNGHSTSDGSYASYLMPAAALGVMGYCYMWWKGWSISDVMFVTKHNMANAVSTVAKQLENVNEALTSTKRHLSKRLENLDWKMEEQKETSQFIANDIHQNTAIGHNLTSIASEDRTLHIWDASATNCMKILRGHSEFVFYVNFSPKSNLIVFGSFDETVRVWDVNTGCCIHAINGHTMPVTYIHFNRDGSLIVSGSHDSTYKIWDTATGTYLKTLINDPTPIVSSAKFSPKGKFILVATLDHNLVKVVKSDLTQIGCDVEIIHQLVSGLEGKIELLESKQDMTNSGLLHLCQMAGGGVKEGINGKLKGIRNNLAEKPTIAMTHKEASLKGLQFIVEPNGVVEDSTVNAKKFDQDANPAMAVSAVKPRIQSRSHAFGISSVQNITGL